ncbi:MAG: DegT/DnrJ/EryC1/StrS family aminotransferase [Planctomycetia bacterium]|nr:DegT/DnrJ/EryC1/StrS family aminotransferase [Planctomycetia bacterium]
MATLALLGGRPTKTKPFPAWPQFDDRERQAILAVLDSGVWWRTPGTHTAAFERDFAAYQQARHGVAVTNGTHALEVALLALGIGPGDEVIVPDYTFVATASAVMMTGAVPVLVDVRPDTYCLDCDLTEAAITPRTKAVIAVHMGGHPADLNRLTAIAERHGLLLVEDCAHAHGSQWNGRPVGTFGRAGTFSFQQSKLMTAGEGGLIVTNDDDTERLLRSVHDCGRMPGEWFYSHFIYGSNYRLSEWQGAILAAQLTRLDEQTGRRHANARLLDRLLAEIEGVTPQSLDPRSTRNGQYAYIFHYDGAKFAGVPTKRFIEALAAEGIPNQAAYPPVHALDLFTSGAYRSRLPNLPEPHPSWRGAFPVTDRAAWETYWVPQYALLGDEQDVHEIAAAVRKVQEHAGELQ